MSVGQPALVDLEAYCARIGYTGPLAPTREVLEALHLAHATHIPFENLDVLLGRPIHLDLDRVQAKLVQGKRGGYCFEQNNLLAAVLRQFGFAVTTLAARVRLGTTRILPRTHMLLRVDLDGEPWLADVGFGSTGILRPIPLVAGRVVRQYLWNYRLTDEAGLWLLQTPQARSASDGTTPARRASDGTGKGWQDVYAFTLEPQYPADFEMANHYVSTHPDSRFTQMLTVQLPTPEAQHLMRNREYTVTRGDRSVTRVVEEEELLPLLAETFGLHFPPGTRFRYPAVLP